MPSISTLVAALAALSVGALGAPSVKATGCCDTTGDCLTVSGTTGGGLHWCYGYHAGNIPFTADDGLTAQCLTQAHAKENKMCIATQGSSCDSGKSQNVGTMLEKYLYGDHTLDQDSSLAIQAAIGAAVGDGLKWSDDDRFGPGYISFAHVADNGSGIRGVEVYNKNIC